MYIESKNIIVYSFSDIIKLVKVILDVPSNSPNYKFNDISYDIWYYLVHAVIPVDNFIQGSIYEVFKVDTDNTYLTRDDPAVVNIISAYNTVFDKICCNSSSSIYVQMWW